MKLVTCLKHDLTYQRKYGFYFLYILITLFYIIIIKLVPESYKSLVVSIVLLSDPTMLGFFFIGGIWLLERSEQVHQFWSITPLTSKKYLYSKEISLGIISTLSSLFIIIFIYYYLFITVGL